MSPREMAREVERMLVEGLLLYVQHADIGKTLTPEQVAGLGELMAERAKNIAMAFGSSND